MQPHSCLLALHLLNARPLDTSSTRATPLVRLPARRFINASTTRALACRMFNQCAQLHLPYLLTQHLNARKSLLEPHQCMPASSLLNASDYLTPYQCTRHLINSTGSRSSSTRNPTPHPHWLEVAARRFPLAAGSRFPAHSMLHVLVAQEPLAAACACVARVAQVSPRCQVPMPAVYHMPAAPHVKTRRSCYLAHVHACLPPTPHQCMPHTCSPAPAHPRPHWQPAVHVTGHHLDVPMPNPNPSPKSLSSATGPSGTAGSGDNGDAGGGAADPQE
ncbi:hypothetical protein GGX14DRAFT_661772 [Mycena pura]|uniref:Uncharacterized protein n=1 Tax=Mycena pura TaxID=153505 RepID=A0AAD6V1E9_9AGAR|nr:hypothetical protein GGX14DRAFT_661772 [Mycena pura]